MKDKKEEKEPLLFILDDFVEEGENKYQVIVKIAAEINRRFELSNEKDNTLLLKVLEEFRKKK